MASKAEAAKVLGLECPLCLDGFKNATLLDCGHTFCKVCLEDYDEQHNRVNHIICPVCRKSTELGPHRISGLTPNFSVLGVEDKNNFGVSDHQAIYCLLHSRVYKDIFCVDCGLFICLKCCMDSHKDHQIIKKEEMEGDIRGMRVRLIQKSETRKSEIEKGLNSAQQDEKDMHHHLNNLEKDIRDNFARKVMILQENEELLLKNIDDIRKDFYKESEWFMTHHRQQIDDINSSLLALALLTENIGQLSDSSGLQGFYLICREIYSSLQQSVDKEFMARLKQDVEKIRFCPADEKLLDIGYIEQGVKTTASSIKPAKTSAGLNKKAEELQATSQVIDIPAAVTHNSATVVRQVELHNDIEGMAALSQDAVVVGYGMFRQGTNCILVSGDHQPHLKSKVGGVYDIALLLDGRSVVSQDDDTCLMFTKESKQIRDMKFKCSNGESYAKLCSDQHGNIFVVNGSTEIRIFHGNKTPTRVVPTGNISPRQICATNTGAMITSTCSTKPSTVTVFDSEGRVGTSISASDDNEYLYAAVDSQDGVLVVRMRLGSDTLGLARYTIQGTTLTKEVTFKPLKLDEPCQFEWSYMVSLTCSMLAFANATKLYFIELAV